MVTSYFATTLSDEELDILRIRRGESAAQQVVEALAVLVALRAWSKRWCGQRAIIHVRSDSTSALVHSQTLKTCGRGPGIVAREIALDIAHAVYTPHVAEHVPGEENVIADALSRKYAPGFDFQLPERMAAVQETMFSTRGHRYLRTLAQPST